MVTMIMCWYEIQIYMKILNDTKKYIFDITIIVITYNSKWFDLIRTLNSIISQRKISFEIIVCDDGSEKKYNERLVEYFSGKKFELYTLIFHPYNRGTVSNCYSGLKMAKGKYTKIISPGDFFTNDTVLYNWVCFIESKGADWSFSDAFYYSSDRSRKFLRKRIFPQNTLPYLKNERRKCIWNYIVLKENACGAVIIGKTQIQFILCKMIKERGVIYTEDTMWHIMMFLGNVGCYYPKETIFYEYGKGVSTSNSSIWKQRVEKDLVTTYQIMFTKKNLSEFQKSIIKALSQRGLLQRNFVRGNIYHLLKCHLFPRLTKIPK